MLKLPTPGRVNTFATKPYHQANAQYDNSSHFCIFSPETHSFTQ